MAITGSHPDQYENIKVRLLDNVSVISTSDGEIFFFPGFAFLLHLHAPHPTPKCSPISASSAGPPSSCNCNRRWPPKKACGSFQTLASKSSGAKLGPRGSDGGALQTRRRHLQAKNGAAARGREARFSRKSRPGGLSRPRHDFGECNDTLFFSRPVFVSMEHLFWRGLGRVFVFFFKYKIPNMWNIQVLLQRSSLGGFIDVMLNVKWNS